MKEHSLPQQRLHLVPAAIAEPAEPPAPAADPDQQERDHLIAEGILTLQKLQRQLDTELFSGKPDLEVVGTVLQQKHLLEERLAAYGVRVRV